VEVDQADDVGARGEAGGVAIAGLHQPVVVAGGKDVVAGDRQHRLPGLDRVALVQGVDGEIRPGILPAAVGAPTLVLVWRTSVEAR